MEKLKRNTFLIVILFVSIFLVPTGLRLESKLLQIVGLLGFVSVLILWVNKKEVEVKENVN